MIVLGIDPSLECGLALIDDSHPHLIASTCIKPGTDVAKDDRLAWITSTVEKWLWYGSKRVGPDLIAIETPSVGRVKASPLQWRLVGQLERAFAHRPVCFVSPGQAKQAVGLKYHDKQKPVAEVEALVGIKPLSDVKYAREAVADAIAVAIAGANLWRENLQNKQNAESEQNAASKRAT